jgi:ArsR family transcriptional regulator
MDQIRNIFKALSDPNRLRIIKMLETKPLCVCEITKILGIAASTASAHLSMLRESGLVSDKKSGKWVEYYLSINSDSLAVRQQLSLIAGWMNGDKMVLADRENLKTADRNLICKT